MSSKDFKAVDVLPEMKNYMNTIKIKHIPTDTKKKYNSHFKEVQRQFILKPPMSDHGPRNTDLGYPKLLVPMWKQFHDVFIVTEQRKP